MNQFREEYCKKKFLSKKTTEAYSQDLILFFRFLNIPSHCEPTFFESLTLRNFRYWLEERYNQDYAPRSTKRAISSLRSFFHFLFCKFGIQNEALRRLTTPKTPLNLPITVEPDALFKIIFATNPSDQHSSITDRDRTLWALLYGAGLRISEALNLSIGDIQNKEVLKVIGKGNKERHIPLIPVLQELITHYLSHHPQRNNPESPLFLGVQGKRMHAGVAQRSLRSLRHIIGPDTTPHTLRHAFASHLLERGVELRSLQTLLGHKSLTSTQIYTHIQTNSLIEAYKNTHPRATKTIKKEESSKCE